MFRTGSSRTKARSAADQRRLPLTAEQATGLASAAVVVPPPPRHLEVGDCVERLCDAAQVYLPVAAVDRLRDACRFGARAHGDQLRKSGDPYITHPISVARILAALRLDEQTLAAAVLHDVIEDTPFSKTDIAAEFGEEVAELVDGVSKLTQIHFRSKQEAQAENFRKMFLAMAKDMRVIIIKLADRLHNMQTLDAMPPEKRRRIARETLEIFAPIAGRLGMNGLRLQLENLGFQALYPRRYSAIKVAVRRARGNHREMIGQIQTQLSERLGEEGIEAQVVGREKPLWAIYTKMRGRRFRDVFDAYAFRIVVDSIDTCYRSLGLVHGLYKPVAQRFRDYIAVPKGNGYQSLHTALVGPHGVPIEVQIQTAEMHVLAEAGVAAHWLYQTDGGVDSMPRQRARHWMQKLLEVQQSAGNSQEFLDNVKVDLFPDEVYVFTPKGEIISLPKGATAVDFAYAIHSDLGNHCVAVKVDRRLVPLHTQLRSGQIVEIRSSPTARPSPAWLNFVATVKARSSIRHFLRTLQSEEAVELGQRLLGKVLTGMDHDLDDYSQEVLQATARELGAESFDEILADVGLGNRLAPLVARRLMAGEVDELSLSTGQPLAIAGTEGTVVSFAKCCHPIPGDPVLGFITAGKGIVVHREACRNLRDKDPEKWLPVHWSASLDSEFQVDLRMEVRSERGVLAMVASNIAECQSNIEKVSVNERVDHATMDFVITVRNRVHLARILRRLRAIPQVFRISRV
jgi:RelA/SpoT family (p)ppGpp synthetase